jgi:hypothetical protein
VDSTTTGCKRSKGRLLVPAGSESVHATATGMIRPTTERSEFPSASRLLERSHDLRGRSYIEPAIFIAAMRPEHSGLPSGNVAVLPLQERPFSGPTETSLWNAPFRGQDEHSVCDPQVFLKGPTAVNLAEEIEFRLVPYNLCIRKRCTFLKVGKWSASCVSHVTPRERAPQNPLDIRLGGSQRWTGHCRQAKNVDPAGIQTWAVHHYTNSTKCLPSAHKQLQIS